MGFYGITIYGMLIGFNVDLAIRFSGCQWELVGIQRNRDNLNELDLKSAMFLILLGFWDNDSMQQWMEWGTPWQTHSKVASANLVSWDVQTNLVGGFNHLELKNMKVNGKDYPIYYGK